MEAAREELRLALDELVATPPMDREAYERAHERVDRARENLYNTVKAHKAALDTRMYGPAKSITEPPFNHTRIPKKQPGVR